MLYHYKASLIRIIDGDTIDAEIDLGFGVFIKQRIRLYGINTPESRTTDLEEKARGLAAKAYLESILPQTFIVETLLNKRGKFGRVLGILHVENEEGERTNINEALVTAGHAVVYDGGAR